jgi:hypothetical protein
MARIMKLVVEHGHPRAVCDFCLKKGKGKSYRLKSAHRTYRFLNICPECLTKLKKVFKRRR